ncbi:MAG: hypothetical protein H7321_03235 [Bacteroidia bacterium]|nr:hypothetical protein [Bacteroidia bacterium]
MSVIKYRPIKDFGGWGLKWGKNTELISIKGTNGIEIILNNASKVMIGTSKPDEAKEAVKLFLSEKNIPETL